MLIAILSHGSKDGVIFTADSTFIKVNDLWDSFVGSKCEKLIGKPKLFFVQACRGDRRDSGVIFDSKRPRLDESFDDAVDSLSEDNTFKIPTMADILVMYSTYEGHVSFRDTKDGSWFIQTVCKELQENKHDELLTILTGVNRSIAYSRQSNIREDISYHEKKQIPTLVSTLTKALHFVKKP